MSTNFPGSLDNSSTLPAESASTKLSTNHVIAHQNIQDALEAVEAKIGVDSSAVTTSHDYKLSGITGSDKSASVAGTENLLNKTLTSPVINVGSDATGDIYYRNAGVLTRLPIGTDNHILKVNGTVPNWEAETTVVAATESTEGISRLATAAQITAGTASEASYPLVVTPDQLALSTPVFNGSGLTGLTKLLNTVTTDVTFSSSTAENTLLSYSVAGGTLSTSNVIRVTMHVTALAVSNTNSWTLRFKYGATTLTTKAYTAINSNTTLQGKMEFLLVGSGSTSSQNGSHMLTLGEASYNNTVSRAQMFSESTQGTSAIDSTSSQTLAITSQHSNSSAVDNITVSMIMVEVLR